MGQEGDNGRSSESLAIVVPVYQGASSLDSVIQELLRVAPGFREHGLALTEIVLVHDGAIDDSAHVIQRLELAHEPVHAVWLSRNFGQHAATLAGCASTTADWIVTMDEDGMHKPASIVDMYLAARKKGLDLVYAVSESSPHHPWRSATSRSSKWIAERLLGVEGASYFSSFRLLDGRVARALAAYSGHGVYFDVAASWVFASRGSVPTEFRAETRRGSSGYRLHSLLTHFRRLTVTAGARPLRLAAALGLFAFVIGSVGSVVLIFLRLRGAVDVPGWTSVMVVMTAFFGLVLLVLGLVAEYLSAALAMVSGRPPYLIVGGPPSSVRRAPRA